MNKYNENIDIVNERIDYIKNKEKLLLNKKKDEEKIKDNLKTAEDVLKSLSKDHEFDLDILKAVKSNIVLLRILKYFCFLTMMVILGLSIPILNSQTELFRLAYIVLGEVIIGLYTVLINNDLKNNKNTKEYTTKKLEEYPKELKKQQEKVNNITCELDKFLKENPYLEEDLENLNNWLDLAHKALDEIENKRILRISSKEVEDVINEGFEEVKLPDMPVLRTRKED